MFSVTRQHATQLDEQDALAQYRDAFIFPKGKDIRYFCGHSLGLQAEQTKTYMQQYLSDWGNFAVDGHWKGASPWLSFHEWFQKPLSLLTGAYPDEVVAMNSLTVNLHICFASFYRPHRKRYKILTEYWNFSSDRFALESLVSLYGYDPKDAIITLKPKKNRFIVEWQDIEEAIAQHGSELALVFFNGVNYYTGQAFPMEAITRAAHRVGAYCGFDLAHAIGNITLSLHDWRVDFAVWCSYKYLNGGPGAVGGAFIHQRHALEKNTPRMAGWWGHEASTRFQLSGKFKPVKGVDGFQMSNAPIANMIGLKASLELFLKVDAKVLAFKREHQYQYLCYLLSSLCTVQNGKKYFGSIISPQEENQHGSMVCIHCPGGKSLVDELHSKGFWVDWREPDVIRITPSPWFTSYSDIYALSIYLSKVMVIK